MNRRRLLQACLATSMASTLPATADTESMYTIHNTATLPPLDAPWDAPAWSPAETATLTKFHAKSSAHRPKTQARVLHDGETLALMYRVEDRFVVARAEKFQDPAYKDSCVEFFVAPKPGHGYFNFEMNCGGTLLLHYHAFASGDFTGADTSTHIADEWEARIPVYASLPKRIDPEIAEPTIWTVSYRIPVALFDTYAGETGSLSGQEWRGNFYKCADDSSHPHWGYWSEIGEQLNFHQPRRFGRLILE